MTSTDAIVQAHKTQIQTHVTNCKAQYDKGLTYINRRQQQWSLKGNSTFQSVHSCFKMAFKQLNMADDRTKECKKSLDRKLEETVAQESNVSSQMRSLDQQLARVKRLRAGKAELVREKSEELASLRRQCRRLESDLEDKEEEAAAAKRNADYANMAKPFLSIFGGLGGAVAGYAAGEYLDSAHKVLQEKVNSLRRQVNYVNSEYSNASRELETLKREETQLSSKVSTMRGQLQSLASTKAKLKQQIANIPRFSEQTKLFLNRLSLILNKFECLKNDTDPEYCYDISVIKGPVQELERQPMPALKF